MSRGETTKTEQEHPALDQKIEALAEAIALLATLIPEQSPGSPEEHARNGITSYIEERLKLIDLPTRD